MTFTFGNAILSVGQQVTFKANRITGRMITGRVAGLPHGDGQWIAIATDYKTNPLRTVSVRCDVQPVSSHD
jgi:hypothetical protein